MINVCKLIDQINDNQLLNSKIKTSIFWLDLDDDFQEVMNTLIAVDIV